MIYATPSQLRAVNDRWNRRIEYRSDFDLHKRDDFWINARKAGNKGDCEDKALAKSDDLSEEQGVSIETLHLAICYTEPFNVQDAESGHWRPATLAERCHLVLVVERPDGWRMLCNRHALPIPLADLERLGYIPLFIQPVGGVPQWVFWLGNQPINDMANQTEKA